MDRLETAQFRATAGTVQGFGATPQEALQALMERLPTAPPAPIIIWPYNRGDVFFTDEQHTRLQELKSRRDTLSEFEREELELLVETEFDAAIARTRTLPQVKS